MEEPLFEKAERELPILLKRLNNAVNEGLYMTVKTTLNQILILLLHSPKEFEKVGITKADQTLIVAATKDYDTVMKQVNKAANKVSVITNILREFE